MNSIGKVLVAGLIFASSAATAEGYWSLSADIGAVESVSEFGPDSASEATVVGLTGAVGRKMRNGDMFWGYEISATLNGGADFEWQGQTCTDGADGPYMCSQTASLRSTLMVGRTYNDYDIYGKVGIGAAFGDFAVDSFEQESGSISGATFAIGASRSTTETRSLFAEIYVDNFRNASNQPQDYTSEYSGNGIRFGIIQSF